VQSPGVELRLSDPVVHLDPARRSVTAHSGRTTAYDVVVLPTGSTAFVYRTLEDLAAVKAAAASRRSAAVVGGGDEPAAGLALLAGPASFLGAFGRALVLDVHDRQPEELHPASSVGKCPRALVIFRS